MVIVADSGSSKTDWAIIDNRKIDIINGIGINPNFISNDEIMISLQEVFSNFDLKKIKEIYFFGAGTGLKKNVESLNSIFENFFISAEKILIETDLVGASKSLFKNENGIACILGTGANSCLFEKGEISKKVQSLGYLLGDNGSGAVLGLNFLKMYLHGEISSELSDEFEQDYSLNYNLIIDRVYKQSSPNSFFASFSPFILKNIREESIMNMVKLEFRKFVEYFILQYPSYDSLPIRFVGSISYNYRTILSEVLAEYNLKIDKIITKPIDGLVDYYSN